MEELLMHLEFAKILGIFSLLAILATIIVFFISSRSRIIKYIPGLLLMIFGLYNLVFLGREFSTSEGFNRIYFAVIGFISGFLGLAMGLIIGIIKKEKK